MSEETVYGIWASTDSIGYMGKHLGEKPKTKSQEGNPQEPFIDGDVQKGKI